MARPRKSEAEKLNDLQQAGILWTGSQQLLNDEQPVEFAYSVYERYYSDKPTVTLYADVRIPTKEEDRGYKGPYTNVSIRTNTFKALDRRGLVNVTKKGVGSKRNNGNQNARYYVALTISGWEVFKELAEKKQAEIDAYEADREATVAKAVAEKEYFVIEVTERRVETVVQKRTNTYKFVATSYEEAREKALAKHNEDGGGYRGWWSTESKETSEPTMETKAGDTGNVTVEDRAMDAFRRKYPAPATYKGMEKFTKEGKLPNCMIPKTTVNMVRFADVMVDEGDDKDSDGAESAPTVNMDRFAFLREDD